MIDPEFWTDEEIGSWAFTSRLFYIALWNFADDAGRFKANDALLKSQIFPYDDKIDMEEIKMDIGNKVLWYEVDHLSYGYIRNFLKYQRIDRPTQSRIPPPPQELLESSTSPRRVLDPNIIEVNISKGKEVGMALFEKFYSKYPRKEAKADALKAFLKISPNTELLETILRAVEIQSKSTQWQKDGGQFIPLPASWLRSARWEDETKGVSNVPRKISF